MSSNTRFAVFAIMALAAAFGGRAPLFPAEVEQSPPQTVCGGKLAPAGGSVEPQPIHYTVDNSQDARTLTGLENKGPNQRVLGRTVTKFKTATTFKMNNVRLADGRLCVSPFITVQVALDPITVYVASEYPPGSCEERIILEHEQRHLAVSERQLTHLARTLQADLQGLFADGMLIADDIGAAVNLVTQKSREAIRARIAAARAQSASLQAQVDSTEEITRLSDLLRVCAPPKP